MTDKKKYDFIDHVVHLTIFAEDRLLNEHGGEYSRLQEDGIDSNEYYRIITERVISILKKNKNYMQKEPVSEDLGEITLEGANFNKSWYAHPELAFKAGEFRGRQFGVPVSEDLKKTAKQYSFYIPTQCEATETWKKETEQHFIDGAKWKEQQMMAKAINTKASLTMSVPSICISLPLGVNVGDKVKVVVIEED